MLKLILILVAVFSTPAFALPAPDKIIIDAEDLPMCYRADVIDRLFTIHSELGRAKAAEFFQVARSLNACRFYTGPLTIDKVHRVGMLDFPNGDKLVAVISMLVTDGQVRVYLLVPLPTQSA